MYDHYTLDVRAGEHRPELMQDAEIDRLLQEGAAARPSLAVLWGRVAGRLSCLLSGWRYCWQIRRGVVPPVEPCS